MTRDICPGRVPLSLIVGLMAAAASAGLPARGSAQELACARCHGEAELLTQMADTAGASGGLLVTAETLAGSAHGEMSCAECHRGFRRFPHAGERDSTLSCGSCHEEESGLWEASCHGPERCEGEAICSDCHGVHEVETADALAETPGIAAMNARCTECHGTQALPPDAPHATGEVACHACHEPHDVQAVDLAASSVAPARQPATCGTCHDSIAGLWVEDVHGRAVTGGGAAEAQVAAAGIEGREEEAPSPPACTTCHGAHPTVDLAAPGRPAAEVSRCADCHEEFADTFGDSYHGQAATLGSPAAASCADCHTAHRILPASNPASTVSEARLVETCGTCHPRANASFVEFEPHADPHDRAKNPLLFWTYRGMSFLLIGVLTVFGLHTLLWLLRIGVGHLRGETTHGTDERETGDGGEGR